MTESNQASRLVLVVLLGALLGCGAGGPTGGARDSVTDGIGEPAAKAATEPSGEHSDEPQAEVTVELVDRAGFDQVIARHRGRVVLVDFWATWCVPCREQFPHTVEIDRKYRDEGLAVVSVSMDEPDSRQAVLDFLKQAGAGFEHFISTYGIGEEGFESFEIGGGGIPHYKIYDRQGAVRRTTNDPSEIEEKIQELLRG